MNFFRTILLGFILLIFLSIASFSQEYDTLSNWDGVAQTCSVSTPGSEVVTNPAPDGITQW